ARSAVRERQLAAGHAVLQADPYVSSGGRGLILSGDVPLTRPETLKRLLDEHERAHNALTVLTMRLDDPAKYGRIVRNERGDVEQIVEFKDATDEQRQLDEVNAGIYVFESDDLFENLRNLSTSNAQGEYYLTDV